MKEMLYGVAYYDEYMPEERLDKDMQMMKAAGINVIRIAESTWSSEEPEEGRFDFSHVIRSIEAAKKYGLYVIVGTPTYAIPPWLAHKYPEVIALTEDGQGKYGPRQNMDITNPHYLYYAERIIRKLMECVNGYDNVIGYQLDNETKHYHTAGKGVHDKFVEYLKQKFGTIEALNKEFGFAYWSNQIDCWEHVPDATGTINGSFFGEFEKFRRTLVDDFLMWQRNIVDEYRRPDQFVTHNFDFEWRDYSFGVQPDVNHFHAAKAVTLAGCDIYHHTQDLLTGKEAAFCGAITRSLKKDNYLILETEAQGHIGWTPYDGQLRMQAFTHMSNGADGVMYWHWHSIHNSFETYWRGLLSHDMAENRPYREAMTIGQDLKRFGDKLLHLKKKNKTAILVSNESLTAFNKLPMFPLPGGNIKYNDVVRSFADALYDINVEYDIVSDDTRDFSEYELLVVPVLYSAKEELLEALDAYVAKGGHLVTTFKSGYANEFLTVYHDKQPHILHKCLGIGYQEYTVPRNVSLQMTDVDSTLSEEEAQVSTWMELVMPETALVLANYKHPNWGEYAAVTRNEYEKGTAYYIGCHVTQEYLKHFFKELLVKEDLLEEENQAVFPVRIQSGINQYGKAVHYYFNFSGETVEQCYYHADAIELVSDKAYQKGDRLIMKPWSVFIFEEDTN